MNHSIHISQKKRQILFFILAGALSALIEVGTMKVFSTFLPMISPAEVRWHGIAYPMSNILSSTAGVISNYFFSIWFVFETGKYSRKREFTYFILVSLVSTLLSLTFFNLLFLVVHRPISLIFYTLSPVIFCKVAAIAIVSILNFTIKKRVIFNS